MFSEETIQFVKKLEDEANMFNYRLDTPIEDGSRTRDEYERDYARVLYSSSFRRLQGKMQLLGVDHTSFHRNRLTHSLEVAQIARTIANGLRLSCPVVAETCSLAHDLGNPPFGHSGEVVLNELAQQVGGFEGNAQVIRILRSLEKKYPTTKGLNLTVRTLLGLTKYFFTREQNPNKFLYSDDYDILKAQLIKQSVDNARSIDVQIMDLSDEIAYAAHDLEDSLSMGYMSISEILYEFQISKDFSAAHTKLKEIIQHVQHYAGTSYGASSSEEYSSILRKELTSRIVNTLVRDIDIVANEKTGRLELGFQSLGLLSKGLKKLVFKSLLRKRNVQIYEIVGENVIRGLFDVYCDKSFNKNGLLLPVEYRNTESDDSHIRAVLDYISGMMDAFSISEYKKYHGEKSLDSLYKKQTVT